MRNYAVDVRFGSKADTLKCPYGFLDSSVNKPLNRQLGHRIQTRIRQYRANAFYCELDVRYFGNDGGAAAEAGL